MSLDIGLQAPDFTLPADDGSSITLSSLKGNAVVLYFYPKDDTPGCTTEACDFRDALPDFSALNARVIGISKDPLSAHDKFKKKYGLNFTLVSDKDSDVTERYGAWVEKSMYGKKYMGIDRSTFLIDRNGVIRRIWRKVKVKGHIQDVLKTAQSLD